MFYLGIIGMPRRYYDYDVKFHGPNITSTLGAMLLIMGLIIIITNLIRSSFYGKIAHHDPWKGKTLEWTVDSPPHLENFDEIPVVTQHPYHYE